MMARAEDIVFWILILTIIGVVIWLAFGSPEFKSSLLMIVIFVASSEILLWRTLFTFDKKNAMRLLSFDKKTSLGFEKVRSDFKLVNNKLENMEKNINEIKDNIISINKKLK